MEKTGCTAIIVAAGNSTRMKEFGNKQLLSLCGIPVIIRTVQAFEKAETVVKIIIVTSRALKNTLCELAEKYNCQKVSAVIEGGKTRQDSVLMGLSSLSSDGLVAIHDGARPFISSEKIDAAVRYASQKGNAVLGVPLSDTAKIVDENDMIVSTPDRSSLRLIQTPQIFSAKDLKAAYSKANEDNFTGTDDSSLVERLGIKVHYIFGDHNNIKITTPEDISKGEAILRGGTASMRIGFGYDVHALTAPRDLILGGVKIPHHIGLAGHSDADVLIHAVMDALLGAAALGDIGKLFPDSDNSFKNIDSRILLRKVHSVLTENGFKIGNIDVTVAAQKPKLSPYIDEMRQNLSEDLGISSTLISVKATTTEHLGFEGREEGISAYAICSIL